MAAAPPYAPLWRASTLELSIAVMALSTVPMVRLFVKCKLVYKSYTRAEFHKVNQKILPANFFAKQEMSHSNVNCMVFWQVTYSAKHVFVLTSLVKLSPGPYQK